jgi:oligopeptide/dipeptide ABC transporter ATP-binding protein
MAQDLLRVEGLVTQFHTGEGVVHAVDGVSFSVGHGETLGLVGESGCGKSVTALSIMGLLGHTGKIAAGRIDFQGIDLVGLDHEEMRKVRGKEIAMIFQEPMTSLNPVYTVGDQIAEMAQLHLHMDRKAAWKLATEMLARVRIPSPDKRMFDYPHHMSGGMRQRVMIAMALTCGPKLLIADEPTTALDVTIQAQILDLLRDLQREFRMSVLMITHDLGVVAEICENVVVMYAGKVVEEAAVRGIFNSPQHPYTEGLLRSIPRLGMTATAKLAVIRGTVPSALNWPPGCRFSPRCDLRFEKCVEDPPLFDVGGQRSACWLCEGGRRPTRTAVKAEA